MELMLGLERIGVEGDEEEREKPEVELKEEKRNRKAMAVMERERKKIRVATCDLGFAGFRIIAILGANPHPHP